MSGNPETYDVAKAEQSMQHNEEQDERGRKKYLNRGC